MRRTHFVETQLVWGYAGLWQKCSSVKGKSAINTKILNLKAQEKKISPKFVLHQSHLSAGVKSNKKPLVE